MKIKILIGVLVFLILVNLATIGSFLVMLKRGGTTEKFRRNFTGRSSRAPYAGARTLRRMSPELREHLKREMRRLHEDTNALRTEVHDLEAQTFELMKMDPVPAERVDSLLEEISRVRLEISRIATKHMIETRSSFTPEERRLFFDALLGPPPDVPGIPGRTHRGMSMDNRREHRGRHRDHTYPDSLNRR